MPWKDTALALAPEPLLLSKNPKSMAAQQFYEGRPEGGRFPWRQWLTPISRWLVFIALFYLAIFFMCAILRRQWVERERLQFPLARVPLEFTEGSAGGGLLPRLFSNRMFRAGLIAAVAFRLVRDLPLFFGRRYGWQFVFPFADILRETSLENLYIGNVSIWWMAIGFAYLVPADVSLSVWFFYLFGRVELQTCAWLGSDLHYGASYGKFMQWQLAGSYLVFTAGALFIARRHLGAVFKKAVGLGRGISDSEEPVSYRLSFWGFLICMVGCVAWFSRYGMKVWVAVVMFLTMMCMMLVQARIVAQSGLYLFESTWMAPYVMQGLGFGHVFSGKGAVVVWMQYGIMMFGNHATLAPSAIHSFRISEVFDRRRRLLLPALFVALIVAIAATSFTYLHDAYSMGALNFSDQWGTTGAPEWMFASAHRTMERAGVVSRAQWTPFGVGIVLTGVVMFLRARFYWWPIHPIGLVTIASYAVDNIWLPFFLGWLVKVSLMKLGSGRMVRQARFFFIGLILVESFVAGVSLLVSTITAGKIPPF